MDECECRTIDFSIKYPIAKNAEFPLNHLQVLNFGSVNFGKKSAKHFHILNTENKVLIYEIKRYPTTNPIYKVFEYTCNNMQIKHGEMLKCKITYMPKIPNEVSIDYLQITDTNNNVYILQLRGESKGFNLQLSATRLYFHNAPRSRKLQHIIELQNKSDMEMHYQFDCDENMHFLLEKNSTGIIGPNGTVFVTFKFKSAPPGIYYNCIYCLSSCHEPLLIELIGFVSKDRTFTYDDYNLQLFPFNLIEYKGYSGYLYDSINLSTILPPFSIHKTYYDFGSAKKQCDGKYRSNVFTAGLTNNLESDIHITWICQSDAFKITPYSTNIHSLEHAIFEITFNPTEPEQFYGTNIRAVIEWLDLRDLNDDSDLISINLPLLANIRVLGNTFPDNKVWIPQIDIVPPVITLPMTIPSIATYTTFLLLNKGYLPTTFKFVPPPNTNFILKPMIGIVREFQIIVVELITNRNDKSPYVECWTVELNNSKEHSLPFYLKGYAELPTVNVGNGNEVVFSTIQYGCEEVLDVQMKNTCGQFVEYNFCTSEHKYITIDHPQGTIAANDIITLKFYFESSRKAPTFSKLRCELRPIFQMKSIRGHQINTFVNIYADLAYSELCATPKEWTCDEMLYDEMRVIKFLLYNFGESQINFTIKTDYTCIDIIPSEGNLHKNNGMEITLHVHGKLLGTQNSVIYYQMRKNENSPQVIDNAKYNIFTIKYKCVVPYIQIEDILNYNFGALFPKITLWKMLNIDRINATLKELAPNETKRMTMIMPDSEFSNETFFVNFLLTNTTNFETDVMIKRKQICDCKIKEVAYGLSFRANVYNCPHRELVALTISNDTVQANTAEDMQITLNYKLEGEHTLCHLIKFSFDRTLELYTRITVLQCPTNIASVYDSNFKLNFPKLFIGLRESYYKAFMLYNNSKSKLKYFVNMSNVENLNVCAHFNIIECMNDEGVIEPFALTHILFKFTPLEAKIYEMNVPLILGDKVTNLRLYGEGFAKIVHNESRAILPTKNRLIHHEDIVVYLSDENLYVERMLTHAVVKKIIFIRNLSKEYIIGYSFKESRLDGMVTINVWPAKCSLKPKEIKALIIEIHSLSKPCKLQIHLICKLLNHTLYIKRKKSEAEYYLRQYELAGQFTITENGIEYPVNDIQLAPKPNFFYKVIAVNVNIISDLNKDILMDINTILQQIPNDPFTLNCNHISKINEIPCYKIHIPDKVLDTRKITSDECDCEYDQIVKSKIDCFTLFRDILDYCISDVIHCKEFANIVSVIKASPNPYYYQIKAEGKGYEMKINQQRLRKRYATTISPKQISNILRKMITHSIYEIFGLGPQESEEDTTYNITLTKCMHRT